jgi:hypothetical protein
MNLSSMLTKPARFHAEENIVGSPIMVWKCDPHIQKSACTQQHVHRHNAGGTPHACDPYEGPQRTRPHGPLAGRRIGQPVRESTPPGGGRRHWGDTATWMP